MILTAHQPVYLPWLGLIHKIALADQFCWFDIVQYQTKDFNNRNKIKTNTGEIWLTVPVESKNHFEKIISEVKIISGDWRRKHLKSIQLAYQKAPFFHQYFPALDQILRRTDLIFLSDLNLEILSYFLKCFGLERPIVKASDFNFQGKKSDLVLDMCVQLKATHYIFGAQGKDYADVASFHEKNIEVYFQDYHHPTYSQLHGEFLPYMSALDLLFNAGSRSSEILFEGNIRYLKKAPAAWLKQETI